MRRGDETEGSSDGERRPAALRVHATQGSSVDAGVCAGSSGQALALRCSLVFLGICLRIQRP